MLDEVRSAAIERATARPGQGRGRIAKRLLDIVIGIPAILVSLPVIVVIAIGAAAALRTTPMFSQDRVGIDQRRFKMLKVRTLPSSVPRYTSKYHLDTRSLPRFTRWLRRLHLDELPQLWNVVSGSMTLVGPRPEMSILHDEMPPSLAAERTRMRPGCTGLWQLSEHAAGLIHEAPEYDRFYIENQTVRLDLWILWQTARITLLRRPLITLDSIPEWTIRPLRSGGAIPATPDLRTSDLRD